MRRRTPIGSGGAPGSLGYPGDAAEGTRRIAEVDARQRAARLRDADVLAAVLADSGPPEQASPSQCRETTMRASWRSDHLLMAGDEDGAKAAMAEAARWARATVAALSASAEATDAERAAAARAADDAERRVDDPQEWERWRAGVRGRNHTEARAHATALDEAAFALFRDGNLAGGRRVVKAAWAMAPAPPAHDARSLDTEAFWERCAREARARVIEGHECWGMFAPSAPDEATWRRLCDPVSDRQRTLGRVRASWAEDADFRPAGTVRAIQQTVRAFCADPIGAAGSDTLALDLTQDIPDDLAPDAPLCCVVGATQAAMTSWIAHLASVGVTAHTPRWGTEEEPHELCCTWCAVDGRPVEIVVWCPWRSPPPAPPPKAPEMHLGSPVTLEPPVSPFRPRVRSIGSFIRGTKAPADPVQTDAARILGERWYCMHASARWRSLGDDARAFARLDCPECPRPAIAVCWLHHFPDTYPVWSDEPLRSARATAAAAAAWEEAYVRLWRATEVRNGRPDAVRTLAELRASAPPVPIDPSAYAERPPAVRSAAESTLAPRRRPR